MKDGIQQELRSRTLNTEQLLKMSQISLWLNDYSDIFSDFDPRPYSERAISDDFLQETKRASIDKTFGTIKLKFLVAVRKSNTALESVIKRRLKAHFKRHFDLLVKEKNNIIMRGLLFSMVGVVIMFGATMIHFKYQDTNIISSFLIVLLEPAGWFSFWEGLSIIFFESKRAKPDLEFYEKMAKCNIEFLTTNVPPSAEHRSP